MQNKVRFLQPPGPHLSVGRISILFFFTLLLAPAVAWCAGEGNPNPSEDRLDWWRKARFGLFIHWGPVSLKGTELSWSRAGERRGWSGTGTIPVEVYDNLYKTFNPVRFDAGKWVEIAKAAGTRYLVFTSKHHDGFANFDSKLTDYKITSPESPLGRDIVKELADACHGAGFRFGLYYSQPDWRHPDYRTENHDRYIRYFHGQIRELCTDYGRIDILWFDGLRGTAEDWDAGNLFGLIRKLQPTALVNNRAGLPGDFDTPEQKVGRFQRDRPWESCITIGTQWSWKPDDSIKSLKECIHLLVKCVGGDGNLLLNVGPMPDGRIEPRQVDRLREIGLWLKKNGESIYGTRGGPIKPKEWGVSTCRGNHIYVHVLDGPENDKLMLPPLPNKIVAAEILGGDELGFHQTGQHTLISIPGHRRNEIDTIVKLTIEGSAEAIEPR